MRSRFNLPSLALLFSLSIVAASCAESGEGNGKCSGTKCKDLSTGNNPVQDLSVPKDLTDPNAGHDFSAASDMTRLFVFGEPCSDPLQCADQICVLAGVSGFCSKQCASKADCPSDFDCYAVLGGGVDPTLVVNICIPEANLLCTQCADSTECSATGRDLCLASITGDKFCARDCSTISCPMNYDCKSVSVGGNDYKQCIPKSGACDCNDDLKDTTSACTITTPTGGSCAGAYTCEGTAKGWSACKPPSDVDTLEDYTDNNCDGVDGILTDAVFVATTGTDADLCGLTVTNPCGTITFGQNVAFTYDRHNVYVQSGYYDETVNMIGGINIVGGFNTAWVRNARTIPGHDVYITGSYYYDSIANRSEYISVFAHEFDIESALVDLVVIGPDATPGPSGKSSYAIHLLDANLKLDKVTILAGNGSAGTTGANGTNATTLGATSGMHGTTPGLARNHGGCCDDSESQRLSGGAGGNNTCDGISTGGGDGGKGGKVDTGCGCCCFGENASSGLAGSDADSSWFYVGGILYSYRGGAGSPCSNGGNAYSGYAGNGAGGGGGSKGAVTSGYWTAKSGVDGVLGSHGTGGGGGGGAGGCDDDVDDLGAGGGGGGAGGCAAKTSGKKGTGAGGSFGVFAYSSVTDKSILNLVNCKITRGIGGKGGDGGNGGRGQTGGSGVAGGGVQPETNPNVYGGAGGNGGHGGHSGAGGGGAGGASVGVLDFNSNVIGACTTSGGAPGGGGSGGDTVGIGDGDGNPNGAGGDGATGPSGSTVACSSSTTCPP